MNKKIIGITAGAVLILGMTSLTYANSNPNAVNKAKNQQYESIITKSSAINNESRKASYNEMLDLMRENGFKGIADDMENGNYKSMDQFMNNMTDEEYQKMIDVMREVNPRMSNMMESFDKEEMIEMHNSCHGSRR